MRNIILLVFLSILFALPSFSAIKRVGDNYTEPEKPRHPFLKDTEIYYLTSDGERKEAEFDLYVLKTPIKDCKECVNPRGGTVWEGGCNKNLGEKLVPCYPDRINENGYLNMERHRARLTISKILKRIDNCTILPFMFDDAITEKRNRKYKVPSMIRPRINGEYDKLKKDALIDMHKQLLFMAQTYSLTKINKCGSYPDLFIEIWESGGVSIRMRKTDYLTE